MNTRCRALLLAALSACVSLAATPAERYRDDVKLLAADEMKGRGAGSPELERAAGYIAGQFAALGVQPAGVNEYFQPFTVTTGAEMGPHNTITIENNAGTETIPPSDGWTPVNFSRSGEVSGPVVFAGYGISASEFSYDDYFHLDVKDKIVVVLRYEPDFFHEEPGAKGRFTHHANLIAKAINARNRGAKAVILVNGERPDEGEDQLIKFGSLSGPDDAGIVMIQAKNDLVEKWFRRSGKSLRLLQRDINLSKEPQSFTLSDNFTLTLSVDVERKQAEVRNVVGYIPGTTDEYVVVGAHYDHLGLGDESSLAPDKIGEVHHGADDNASGTAGLLEIARRFAEDKSEYRRGLLLMAFAGEEIGLLGSAHWVEHPTKPLDKAVAMLNMDMIGRISKGKAYVGGVGTAEGFDHLVKGLAHHRKLELDFSNSGYAASDHTSFTGKRIPVLFFFSGLHGDYHKPSDTWDKINAEGAMEIVGLVGDLTAELRGADDRPKFTKAEPDPHSGAAPSGSGGGGYGPYFGSIPDFAEVPNGVRFADIRPDSPADKGGLKAGDIMTGFDGKPIQNLYDFTYALRDAKVGQTVVVTYTRDGNPGEATVTLEQRR
ncbi:MAG: M28 family peptidase [Acidobacteria bacterium]|nr:M28 family peptidase [Acidobacteriota bacterium]